MVFLMPSNIIFYISDELTQVFMLKFYQPTETMKLFHQICFEIQNYQLKYSNRMHSRSAHTCIIVIGLMMAGNAVDLI